jgi:UDP-N-acetylglucosamine diphosphorylase/glucosamine-1-phosphate N-acetyltransferase
MRIVLFDLPQDRIKLFPFTFTRPISHIRVGILTIVEKWQARFPEAKITISTEKYLSEKFGTATDQDAIWINASFLPNENLAQALNDLNLHESIVQAGSLVAFRGRSLDESSLKVKTTSDDLLQIERTWDIFRLNGQEIRSDYELITNDRKSELIADPHTITYGEDIFIEEGAKIKAAILNAENGPIYIGKNAEIHEGSVIRGPFSLGEKSIVNINATIRTDTTIGPNCKVGGEISNCVIFGNSNKGHDGFLGNAVIGEWCNLGANTNNSNLKNNYAPVKMWDFKTEKPIDTGLQFCGLMMGDHSKAGISTMFNTGTTVGVSSNIFGAGFPKTYIPSFSWGGAEGFEIYRFDKAMETAQLVLARRNLSLSNEDIAILRHIFEHFSK